MRSPTNRTKQKNPQRSPRQWAELGASILNHDQAAYEKLVFDYLPLMKRIAWRVARYVDPDHKGYRIIHDLLLEGRVALCESARKWDYHEGWFFPAYAQPFIWGRLMDHIGAGELIARTSKNDRNAPTIYVQSLDEQLGKVFGGSHHAKVLGDMLELQDALHPDNYLMAMEALDDARKRIKRMRALVKNMKTENGHKTSIPSEAFLSLHGLDAPDRTHEWGLKRTQRKVGEMFGVSDEGIRQMALRIWRCLSSFYTPDDLKRDIAIVLACREVELT